MDSYVAMKPCTYRDLVLKKGEVVMVEEGTEVKHFALKKLGKREEIKGASYEVPKVQASSYGEAKTVDAPVIKRMG